MRGDAWRAGATRGMEHIPTKEEPLNVDLMITGTAPLIMHANTLADPLHEGSKRMKRHSAKRTKTDEDHVAMRRIEFEFGLYLDPEKGPYLPGPNIAKALLLAARIRRNGPKIERGLILVSPVNPLRYKGPRDVSGLWNDPRFRLTVPAKNGQSTIMRCRPQFPEWSCTATALINPTVLSVDELADIASDAGQMIGLGDWRPWHGRFDATVKEAS
jgi:hypothetical protein